MNNSHNMKIEVTTLWGRISISCMGNPVSCFGLEVAILAISLSVEIVWMTKDYS